MFQEWLKDYEKLREENNMSEEDKIIDRVMMIDQWKVAGDIYTQDELNAIGELLDLYIAEKEKNKALKEGLKYRINYCKLLEKELYANGVNYEFEKTEIEKQFLE